MGIFRRIGAAGLLVAALAAWPGPSAAAAPAKPAAAAAPGPAAAPSYWAVTDYQGKLVRGSGVTGVFRYGPGRYEVSFTRNVADCSYTATIADPGPALVYYPGWVFTASGHLSGDNVYVETKNPGAGLSDYPFHLHVMCPEDGDWVVTDYRGNLVRGSGVTGVYHLARGMYEITFSHRMDGCSYVATIGDPGAALVYYPGLVFTASGHYGPYGVYVETKNPGGGLSDYPFHLQAQCPAGESWSEWAVVDADGGLVRGNMIAGVARLSTGRYEVYLHRNVDWCSYVATIGDPGAKLVYYPGMVFTASGHSTSNAVYVETKNPGFGLSDYPFHLQISGSC